MTDSLKWGKEWFQDLKPDHKLVWLYMLDNCDAAGCYAINWKLLEFQIGKKIDQDECIRALSKNIAIFDNDTKIFIPDFIEFQYNCTVNELNAENNAHKGVLRIVEKFNLLTLLGAKEGLGRGLIAPLYMYKDKDKDKDKEKDKRIEKKAFAEFVTMTEEENAKLEAEYGPDKTKKAIDKLNGYKGSTGKKYKSDYLAIRSWVMDSLSVPSKVVDQQSEIERFKEMRRKKDAKNDPR